MRVVVLGAAGNFGARIVRALKHEPGIQLLAAGRRALAVPGAASVPTAMLDIAAPDFAARLTALAPAVVIHCVGPFQRQDYRVARAALNARAHYLDLADGRDFVTGFSPALHAAAVRSGRVALTGASTLPALSTAVIDALCTGLSAPQSIQIVIAPGQRAPRGAATLAAVFSYLGRPIPLWRAGNWEAGWGWMGLKRFQLGFGTRWGALCDVPDLTLLPARYPAVQDVAFHAALEIPAQHIALWMLAGLRRMGVPLPVESWAHGLDRVASFFDRFGGDWGGMQVQVAGLDASGVPVRRIWTLQAPARNGPEIPCMAAVLLAKRLANAAPLPAGAYPCVGFLTLAEFAPLFEHWRITTRTREQAL
jgi:hypothetical protein